MRSFLRIRLGRELALVQSTTTADWEHLVVQQVRHAKLTRKERLEEEGSLLQMMRDLYRLSEPLR